MYMYLSPFLSQVAFLHVLYILPPFSYPPSLPTYLTPLPLSLSPPPILLLSQSSTYWTLV